MMIAEAERLKKELTDKYVVVSQNVPELRRFVGLTGRVKTVNMNCRALVEFDGPVDISWYDIDPSFLSVVDAPQPKKKESDKKPKAEKKTPPKAATDSSGKKLSPLEMARQQGAAGKAPAGDSGKKLSPLELARQQGAAGKSSAPAKDAGKKLSPLEQARQQGAAGSSKPEAKADSGAKLSPLELARQQGAAKSADAGATEETAPVEEHVEEAVVEAPEEESSQPEQQASGAPAEKPGSTEEIIALARQQGPFKG